LQVVEGRAGSRMRDQARGT